MPPRRYVRFASKLAGILALHAVLLCSMIVASPQDDDEDVVPGLLSSFQADSVKNRVGQRVDHRIQTAGNANLARVSWSGLLQIRGSKRVQFHAVGSGTMRIAIDGKNAISGTASGNASGNARAVGRLSSEPIQLRSGLRDLEVEFEPSHSSSFALYWSSDKFSLEPIPSHLLWHTASETPSVSVDEGAALSRGLRCAACHEYGDSRPALPAPDLTRISTNLRPSWLVAHLSQNARANSGRMPALGLHRNNAAAITAALFGASQASPTPNNPLDEIKALNEKLGKKAEKLPTQPSAERGERVLSSVGCLACHQVGQLAEPVTIEEQMFGGGELAQVAAKRTREFFLRWLEDPELVNASHRMPRADLSAIERWDVATYLATLGQDASRSDTKAWGDVNRGVGLIAQLRCAACHTVPASLGIAKPAKTKIDGTSNFDGGCLTQPDASKRLPGYSLSAQQRESLKLYVTLQAGMQIADPGRSVLAENNCISCHSRDGTEGISKHISTIVASVPELAGEAAALVPPNLNSVGDKLHSSALQAAIKQSSAPLRPWLAVRMPKFDLPSYQLEAAVDYLVTQDRLPELEAVGGEELLALSARPDLEQLSDNHSVEYKYAAGRLVTADGFGCQSCHAIGQVEAPSVDLKARGPNLSLLGKRIRADWFYRWVRNPARIVPRMEMPAIQNAARGLLDDSLDKQLDALWRSLNDPGFVPPKPNPTTIVRARNSGTPSGPVHVLTDVFENDGTTYLRPIVVGLHNRQNVLIDLQRAEVAMWWSGDTAYQRTRGKTWYWEPGNASNGGEQPLERYVVVMKDGSVWRPAIQGQVAVQLVGLEVDEQSARWSGTLSLQSESDPTAWIAATMSQSVAANDRNGVDITTVLAGLPGGAQVVLDPGESGGDLALGSSQTTDLTPFAKQFVELAAGESGQFTVRARYTGELTDQFHAAMPPPIPRPAAMLDNTPGFEAQQLPLPIAEMPISFAWNPNGEMFAGSLKGNILRVIDTDGDGLEDAYEAIAPNFPSPYGMAAGQDYLDVLTKFGLLRLTEWNGSHFQKQMVLVDDWGYTNDYHDWAVGLERDAEGNYYIAIPCQQDDRSPAAARRRGTALKLTPSSSVDGSQPRYVVEEISAGLRFPMGIALNKSGDLFTSDNQGNYNPFNEINHLRPGKRYGFINKLEQTPGFSPPFESPAINLPHPWTRSVNGICFLYTPPTAAEGTTFGPFEGHMIGCEMNGRSLIRMSLQKVGDTYQGAAYPLSIEATGEAPQSGAETKFSGGFEGPIVCEVSPAGDIYVGSLQDSGWGGGQNTGSIVRLRPSGRYPLGIAEVRATPTGFNIVFTKEMPADALDTKAYSLRSYRRISTPVYGGDDKDSRREHVSVVSRIDGRTVHLELGQLRAGFVYEIQATLAAENGAPIFPAEAHYTMRSIPTKAGVTDE